MDTKKILIVDDEEHLRSVLQELMVIFGYEASTAADGCEALEKIEHESFDLVITDIHMPGMTGLEFIKLVKKDHPDIDFIAITGYNTDYRYSGVIEAGASDFITKPFETNEVEAKINRIFRERQLKKDVERLCTKALTPFKAQPSSTQKAPLYKPLAAIVIVLVVLSSFVLGYVVRSDKTIQLSVLPAGVTLSASPTGSAQPAFSEGGASRVSATSTTPTPGDTSKATIEALIRDANNQFNSNRAAAQALLEKAIAMDRNNFEALFQLGRILTFNQNFSAAIQHYQNALRLNNKIADIYFNLGYIYMCEQNYDQAIANYEKCWALSPSYKDELLTNLGICYLKKNNPAQAQFFFKQALDLNPENETARCYLKSKVSS
jgi:CheY-like chemotaxis protein